MLLNALAKFENDSLTETALWYWTWHSWVLFWNSRGFESKEKVARNVLLIPCVAQASPMSRFLCWHGGRTFSTQHFKPDTSRAIRRGRGHVQMSGVCLGGETRSIRCCFTLSWLTVVGGSYWLILTNDLTIMVHGVLDAFRPFHCR